MTGPSGKPWRLIDSTLREGEQFARRQLPHRGQARHRAAPRRLRRRLRGADLARRRPRSRSGTPSGSSSSGSPARVITHARCVVDDVRAAIDSGVQGIGLLFATSRILREASHGRSIQQIIDAMGPPIELGPRPAWRPASRPQARLPQRGGGPARRVPGRREARASTGSAPPTPWGSPRPRQVFALFREIRARSAATSASTATTTPAARWPTPGRRSPPAPPTWTSRCSASASGGHHAAGRVRGPHVQPRPPGRCRGATGSAQLRELERLRGAGSPAIEVPFNNPLTGATAYSPQGRHVT